MKRLNKCRIVYAGAKGLSSSIFFSITPAASALMGEFAGTEIRRGGLGKKVGANDFNYGNLASRSLNNIVIEGVVSLLQ